MGKRIPVGKMLRGPDYHGCISGMSPCLVHSANLERWDTHGFRYAVGPEMLVSDAVRAMIDNKTSSKTRHLDNKHYPWRTVYFYKTRSSATKRYITLVDAVLEANTKLKKDEDKEKALFSSMMP